MALGSDRIVELQTLSPNIVSGPSEPAVAPFGIFDMVFDTDVSETISVTVFFPQPVDNDAVWLEKRAGQPWQPFPGPWSLSADRLSLTFAVSDDPATDYDFKQDGRIRFRGGLGQSSVLTAPAPPPSPPPVTPPPSGGGGGGGGSVHPLTLLVFMLLGIGRRSRIIPRRRARATFE